MQNNLYSHLSGPSLVGLINFMKTITFVSGKEVL